MNRTAQISLESRLMDWARRVAPLSSLYRRLPSSLRERVSRFSNERLARQLKFDRTPAWQRAPDSVAAPGMDSEEVGMRVGNSALGINVFGYLRGEFGLGESARQYAQALIAAGVDVALVDLDLDLPHGWQDDTLEALIGNEAPHAVSLIFVNPDYLDAALERIGPDRLQGRRLIACWFWELDRIPEAWMPSLERVDELMVSSRFIKGAFRAVTDKPLLRVPLPLSPQPDSALQRRDFGLPEDAFLFLTSFDFNSWIARKNPYAVIEAFVRAFPAGTEPVRLLLKTSNGFRYPGPLRELLAAVAVDPRVMVRDDIIERAHMTALHRCSDAYVSLHRAEGFGLGMAEAMAAGKPVIATDWSGNLDFMSADVACMVRYRLVAVEPNQYPHANGAYWAEPDVDSAAAAMRRLAEDRDAAARLGARARTHVLETLHPGAAAAALVGHLQALQSTPPPEVHS